MLSAHVRKQSRDTFSRHHRENIWSPSSTDVRTAFVVGRRAILQSPERGVVGWRCFTAKTGYYTTRRQYDPGDRFYRLGVGSITRRNLFDSRDPACVSTSRHALLVDNPVEVLIDEILPLATLIVPNKSEAELIHSHRGLDPEPGGFSLYVKGTSHLRFACRGADS